MTDDDRLLMLALCCFISTVSLGAYVSHRPLAPFDVELNALRGRGTRLAIGFTRSGYFPALTFFSVIFFAVDFILSGGITFAVVLSGTQLLSQWTAELAKDIFRRVRPDDWIYHQELGFSFPSGHATTAVVFFGGLLFFIFTSTLSPDARFIAAALTLMFAAGIPWSRIVLSAHYGTDVLGGLLFGGMWLSLMVFVLRHVPVQARFL